jgi:hypothetical protein
MGKEQFSYRISQNGKLSVEWHGKQDKREIVLQAWQRTSRRLEQSPERTHTTMQEPSGLQKLVSTDKLKC